MTENEPDPQEKEPTPEPTPKKSSPIGVSTPGPFEFRAKQTIALRLTDKESHQLTRLSKKYPKKSKTELITFAINYTIKNHLW
jgi:hypothetical protein